LISTDWTMNRRLNRPNLTGLRPLNYGWKFYRFFYKQILVVRGKW
jgi:hypothetical protein